MKRTFRIGLILIVSALLVRCYDKDVFDTETYNNDFTYNAGFAVPIGIFDLKITDIFDTSGLGNIDTTHVQDTLVKTDTLVDFIIDNHLVENPERFDTTLIYEFSLSSLNTDISYIKELVLRLNITNEQPFTITTVPSFLTKEQRIIQGISGFNDTIYIPAAPINSEGKVIGTATSWDNDFPFDSIQLSKLNNVDFIRVNLSVNTNIPTNLTTIQLDTSKLVTIQVAARFLTEKHFDF